MRKNRQLVRKRTRGGSWLNFINNAKKFLQEHNVLSRGAAGYKAAGLPGGFLVGLAGEYAKSKGYGKKKKCGGMLRATGMRRKPRCGGMLRSAGTRYGGRISMAGS